MKKYLTILFLFFSVLTYGQLDTINIGTAPNDGTGESLRSGMIKVNIAIRQIDVLTAGSTNWNTAYTDRLKWDGGATGLVAATGRTSLGATTVGAAFFMLTNPSAITFPRINADNSITALSAANFKTALSLTATDVGLGNVTNESKATMFTNATFTGTTGGITSTMVGLGNVTNKAQVELEDSVDYPNGYMSKFDGVTGLALKLNKQDSALMNGGYTSYADGLAKMAIADSNSHPVGYITWKYLYDALAAAIAPFLDTVSLETIVTLQSDSIPQFVFLGGGGNAGDTTAFTTSTVYGSYRVHDTTIITSINAVMIAGTTPLGTDTLGIQIYFNDSINVTTGGSVRLLNAATLGINSVTTGTVDASFANNTVYPGERVFCKSPGIVVGRKPIYFECTVYGYIVNRSY